MGPGKWAHIFGSRMVYRCDGRANFYAGIIGYFMLAALSWFLVGTCDFSRGCCGHRCCSLVPSDCQLAHYKAIYAVVKNSERFRDAPLAFFLQKSILILILVSLIIGIWEVIT